MDIEEVNSEIQLLRYTASEEEWIAEDVFDAVERILMESTMVNGFGE